MPETKDYDGFGDTSHLDPAFGVKLHKDKGGFDASKEGNAQAFGDRDKPSPTQPTQEGQYPGGTDADAAPHVPGHSGSQPTPKSSSRDDFETPFNIGGAPRTGGPRGGTLQGHAMAKRANRDTPRKTTDNPVA